jgi:hypothetical protein
MVWPVRVCKRLVMTSPWVLFTREDLGWSLLFVAVFGVLGVDKHKGKHMRKIFAGIMGAEFNDLLSMMTDDAI